MKLRHGAFSYLPDLTDDEIAAQVRYALLNDWPLSIEYTDDPHPRNIYWEMWGLPLFDLDEPDGVMAEINACRATFPDALHPGARLRRAAGTADDGVAFPGAATGQRARLPAHPGRGQGPPADVLGALVRDVGRRACSRPAVKNQR